jgi:NADP-dependent 3-hydroxy acid dehydrogenase YdfG
VDRENEINYEIEQVLKTGGVAIVNTSSIFGLNGCPGWSLYVATKHAVTGIPRQWLWTTPSRTSG